MVSSKALFAAAAIIIFSFFIGVIYAVTLQTSTTIHSVGIIKAIGVDLYRDSGLTNVLTSIDWGTVGKGESVNYNFWVHNDGNTAVVLSMYPSAWTPVNASDYMTLVWNYVDQTLQPGASVGLTLILSVSDQISGITGFSFDITIVGTG